MSSLNQALRAALDNRHDLLAELHTQGTDCYRLFHGSQEGAGGLTIDRYGPQLLVQSFHQRLERDDLLQLHAAINRHLGLDLLLVYNDRSQGNSRIDREDTVYRADDAALAGVWDHSNFREDMLGRLRRTGQFISGTTFGATGDANWLIDKVRTIHLQVTGTGLDGRPYAASDPELLTWVHVAEVSNFLAAHLRYRNPHLSEADQDRYYDEIALVAERLGAIHVPRSRQQIADYLEGIRPQLLCDERSHEVIRLLLNHRTTSKPQNNA